MCFSRYFRYLFVVVETIFKNNIYALCVICRFCQVYNTLINMLYVHFQYFLKYSIYKLHIDNYDIYR